MAARVARPPRAREQSAGKTSGQPAGRLPAACLPAIRLANSQRQRQTERRTHARTDGQAGRPAALGSEFCAASGAQLARRRRRSVARCARRLGGANEQRKLPDAAHTSGGGGGAQAERALGRQPRGGRSAARMALFVCVCSSAAAPVCERACAAAMCALPQNERRQRMRPAGSPRPAACPSHCLLAAAAAAAASAPVAGRPAGSSACLPVCLPACLPQLVRACVRVSEQLSQSSAAAPREWKNNFPAFCVCVCGVGAAAAAAAARAHNAREYKSGAHFSQSALRPI